MKQCITCNISKELLEFNKLSKSKDGHWGVCKLCRRDSKKEYYGKNKNSILDKQAKYRNENSEKVKKTQEQYRKDNRDKLRLQQKEIYQRKKEERKEYARLKYKQNPDKYKEKVKQYIINNRPKVNAMKAKYRAAKLCATPGWLTKEHISEIESFFKEAKRLESIDSIPRHVDHIVPLQGENICGLHVPWNLQILTKSENCSKRNKLVSN